METRKRCAALFLRSLRSAEWSSELVCPLAFDDSHGPIGTNCANGQDRTFTKFTKASAAGWPALVGRRRHSGLGVALPYTGGVSQVRHMSWRRYLPSFHDFRNAVEGPDRQVTNFVLAVNCATYLLAKFDRGVAAQLAMIPYEVARGEWYRLVTCGFLHLDFLHLLVNMLSVHWLGPEVESATGRGRFAAIYLTSIMAGSWAQYHFGSFATASLGASGGVFGLFGAYLVFRLRNRHFIEWVRGDTSWLMQVVGINVLLGLIAGGYISQMAHLGGALAGAASCWLIGPRYRWVHGRVVDRPLLPLFRTRE